MLEKFTDILKIFLDKNIYRAISALCLSLLAVPVISDISFLKRYSKTELKIIVFLALFLLFSAIVFMYRYTKDKIKEIQFNKEKEKEYIDEFREKIINLSPDDKKILSQFLDDKNSVITIKESQYIGQIVDIQGYDIFGYNEKTKWVIIVKRYSKPYEINENDSKEDIIYYRFNNEKYVDIQVNPDFYWILSKVFKKYGKTCFEWT